MENRYRDYVLKRKDQANIARSLQGAASRACNGTVVIGFCTKSYVFPDEYDQIKIPFGGAYIEAYTAGIFEDGFLRIIVTGWEAEQPFEHWIGIKLREIDGDIYVSYMASEPADEAKVGA